ncbi:U32 family peptidase [Parabacteroides sp. OttesenSCG-928-G07]|nr:U32 family peptidase [Parabacteroides sp. OttesenSCG-928-G07]
MAAPARSIELLSPAKDLACGIEAINHGADAVYIGAPKFSARAAAGNTLDDIGLLCDYAHQYDAKVYIALNTILKDEELDETEQLIRQLYQKGADALIIQDMGITRLQLPPIPLHASTQMDNRTVKKVQFLGKTGFSQVVLARELSLEQIQDIKAHTHVALEAFIHGALCVSYSGQCYLSAALSGRSANRGECAQYCRLPYTMTDARGEVIATEKHLLSLKDLNLSDYLEDLLDAGVSSFKIEGRLKDVGYVKNITAYYRKKLDQLFLRRQEYKRSSAGKSVYTFEPVPEKSFNRGFTSYFLNARTPNITSFDTPKSMGEPVGKVKEIRGNSFTVSGLVPLHNGDGLTFFNSEGKLDGFRVNKVEEGNRVYPVEMPKRLGVKMLLYRNADQAFERLLSKPSAQRKIDVEIELSDNPYGFTLCAQDETRTRVILSKAFEKEVARTDQQKNIRTQLSKSGNTIFEVKEVKIDFRENWFLPSSFLAEMRREGLEKLLSCRKIRYHREYRKAIDEPAIYPENQLTYLGNVSNKNAADFYTNHAVKRIEPAFEEKPLKGVPVMFTKHCLRYSMGWCPIYQKKQSPYQEPYFLSYKNWRLQLEFDCKNCRMIIKVDE